jgi:hypothetical protein
MGVPEVVSKRERGRWSKWEFREGCRDVEVHCQPLAWPGVEGESEMKEEEVMVGKWST